MHPLQQKTNLPVEKQFIFYIDQGLTYPTGARAPNIKNYSWFLPIQLLDKINIKRIDI